MRKPEGSFFPSLSYCFFRISTGVLTGNVCFHFRQRGLSGKATAVDGGGRRVKVRDRVGRAIPAPEANAEIQTNLDVSRVLLPMFRSFHNWFTC